MVNYKAGTGKLIRLHNHVATGSEASLAITLPSLTDNRYSKIIIEWTLLSTATFALEMILNGDATGYGYTYTFNDTSTNAVTTATDQTEYLLMSTNVNSAANHCSGTATITISDSSGAAKDIHSHAQRTRVYEDCSGFNADNAALTAILITTSTSTWVIGSRFTVYGVLR